MAIPSLIGLGLTCYGVLWLRQFLSGRVRLLPDVRLLWLLFLAALIYAACWIYKP